jgi:hypothetical protein
MERALARYEAHRNADRAAAFELTCDQARLRPVDDELERVLTAAHRSPATAA